MKPALREHGWLLFVIASTFAARVVYWAVFGVRFNDTTLPYYIQYIDPPLLRTRLLESLLYLHEQPPLFNLFLGVVLKLFPHDSSAVFRGIFLACGLLLAAGLFLTMVRLGVSRRLAALVTLGFSIHPATVLYENYLFYTYVVACMLGLAALFLQRYVEERKTLDGVVLALLLTFVVLTRGTFHPAWLLVVLGGVWLVVADRRRQVLQISLIPIVLVGAVYAKNYFVFGNVVSSKFILSLNLKSLTVDRLPPDERERLVREGKLSPLSAMSPWEVGVEEYERILGPFEDTGVPLLDQRTKTQGWINYHHHGWDEVGVPQYRDAMYVLRHYPRLYLGGVRENLGRYFDPAASYFEPSSHANGRELEPLLRGLARVQTRGVHAIVFGACLLFSGWVGAKWLLRCAREGRRARNVRDDARACTLLFCLFTIVCIALVTVLLSDYDQSRYRFEVSPLYVVVFGALVSTGFRSARA